MAGNLIEALEYASRGIRVIPVHGCPGGRCTCQAGADCSKPGKHPRVTDWVNAASDELGQVAEWFAIADTNVGIATGGPADVVDIDGAAGLRQLREVVPAYDNPTRFPGPVAVTGRGWHYYFQPTHLGNKVMVAKSVIDVRSDGGMVVAPNSLHYSGKNYTWLEGHGLDDFEIPVMDPALHRWLRGEGQRRDPASATGRPNGPDTEAGLAVLERAIGKIHLWRREGGRNDNLNKVAFVVGQAVGRGDISDTRRALAELLRAAQAVGLTGTEVPATLKSGVAGGIREPRGRKPR
jgi:hypothetical protein